MPLSDNKFKEFVGLLTDKGQIPSPPSDNVDRPKKAEIEGCEDIRQLCSVTGAAFDDIFPLSTHFSVIEELSYIP